MLKIKVLELHSKGCIARHKGKQPRMYLTRDSPIYLDRAGRRLRRGATGVPWKTAVCNGGCGAEAIVRVDTIEQAVADAMESPDA